MSSDEAEFEFGTKEEEDDVDDDDEPISKSRKRRASANSTSYAEDDDDEDDDFDDVPLAQLKSPKKKAKTTSETKTKTALPAKKPPAKKKTEAAPKKDSPKPSAEATKKISSSDDYRSAAAAMFGSECTKGQIIQKLLCRWWYSIEWPTNLPSKPPPKYDAMDGMPGVYVCVEGDDVGKIKDLRDMKSKPSFTNFLSKGSEELKDLLIRAIQKQMKALVESEGEGTSTEKELKDMLKWVTKVNADKADKEATRVLKKAGMASQ